MGTKHVFAGTTRLVSKLVKQPKDIDGDGVPDPIANCAAEPWGWTNGNGLGLGHANGNNGQGNGWCNGGGNGNNPPGAELYEFQQYYFHPDHLGSSSYVTDADGEIFQHLEYFPFGETWVEEHSNTQRTPYLFTGKELDEKTQLYYFGARYYDPRTSVWQSPDPILASYLGGSGSGSGVYSPMNLSLYGYSHQRPVVLFDPDGREVGKFDWDRLTALTLGGAALGSTTLATAGTVCTVGAPACSGAGYVGGGVIGGVGGAIVGLGTEIVEESSPYVVAGAQWVGNQSAGLWNWMTGNGATSQALPHPDIRAKDLPAPPPGRVPLFRAVGAGEAAALLANAGRFTPSPYGSEGKYFALDPLGAAIEGRALHPEGFVVVATTAPSMVVNNGSYFEDATREGKVPSVVVWNPELPLLTPAIPVLVD
ncbi:hypothetical protein OEW28_10410 [Defluviimonas sp. WL0002]|uniref:Teneurin-like YD-shell domain-containing protein n=1 Tax=Albidovulum marisflavi TaxID=2984159 RepID=A0ABT2ZD19_9RHOB|nr:RHS repeat-associated core domain-containing protein [Defluviimonas sp. WL0002]MCV2869038.1 hypothetical protein [Defluviimonas sp. WL0002]